MTAADNFLVKKARAAGAETKADVGIFLIGAAVGGLVDAALNTFGFAEPMVVAPLTGGLALGLKKLIWDASRRTPTNGT